MNPQTLAEFWAAYGNIILWMFAILGLLGIFPLSYLSYRNTTLNTDQERLKDDFRLFGIADEEDLDATVRELYQTAHGNWQFITYVLLILVVSTLLLVAYVYKGQLGWVDAGTMNLVFFGFLGAYLYSIQELVRRYNTFDLRPQVYSSILARILVSVIIVFAGVLVIQWSGGQVTQGTAGSTPEAWAALLAFAVGAFPTRASRWLSNIVTRVFSDDQNNAGPTLRDIHGISEWHESRLLEMGIDNIQNLATIDIRKALLTTRFDTQEMINWIDQAILLARAGISIERYRAVNITSFHELRQRLDHLALFGVLEDLSPEAKEQVMEERKRLATVLGVGSVAELEELGDYSNYPNYVFIAEYYLRTREVARLRAAQGQQNLRKASEEKDFKNAAIDLEKRVRYNRKDWVAYADLAIAYHGLGQTRKALRALEKSLALNPGNSNAYTTLGKIYMDIWRDPTLRKDPDLLKLANNDLKAMAIDAFTTAVRLNNTYTNAYNLRGLAYLEAGQMEKALEDFDQAIALDPRLASAYLNRGIVYNTRSMFARAIEDFKANYLLDPIERYELWLGWGTALIATKQIPEAIDKLTRALRLAPKEDGAAYEKRGYAYQLLDPPRLEAARVDLLTAIERDARLLNAYDYLGLVETQMNRPQEAIRYYKAALEKDPCRTITLNNLGKAYLRLENYQDAERTFRDTIEYAKEDTIEHQEASRLLEFIGQKKADLDGEEK